MGNQLTLADRFHATKRKFTDKIKSALVNDVPPGVEYKKGGEVPSIAVMKQFAERFSLSSILPYEAYDKETGIYYNRDTVGFLLYASPGTGVSPTELKTLNGFFNQNHKADTTIQISVIADPNVEPVLNRWAATKGNATDKSLSAIFETLANNRVDYMSQGKWSSLFTDQAFLLRNFHLVISYTMPIPKGLSATDVSDDDIERLVRTRESTIGTLRSAKIYGQNMPPELFINVMNGVLNPSDEPQPVLDYDDNNLISSQIIDDDTMALFDSGASSLIHKDKAYSILPYHVRQFPQMWPGYKNGNLIGSFTNNILRIPCPFIATLTVNAPDQVSAKGKVQRKSVRATQMADSPMAKYVPQWKDRKVDWDYTAKKVDNGNKLMDAFYQIVLLTPQGREQECEQALKSVYESMGWVLSKSRYTPIHSFLGALPMGLCQESKRALQVFGHFSTRLSWTCTNIAPWLGEWKGTQTPMMLFNGRRGQITYFDPFDNDKGNYNMSCSATSGSGKSFFTQEWVFSCLGYGGRAFIIDAGHSYKNLCKLLKGTYLEFGNDELNICLNPFSSINDEDPKYFKEQLPLLKMLIAQMASPERPLSAKQRAVLEKSIMRTWEKYGNKSTISTVVEVLLSDNTDDGPMHATGKDLAVMLHSYTKDGMYADYFEGESNVNLDSPFVVLELDALNQMPDLQSVVLLILMMRITQVMYLSGNKKQRKLCIIDEAWRLLGSGNAGKFIEEGYRVARKHGGSFMTITQKISDYYASETAKAAYANSDFKVYLRQDPGELAEAEANGHVSNSSGKVDVIKSLETIQGKYSELAIDSPNGLAALRFTVDQVTEKLYSTKAEEVDYIREAEAKGIHIFDAVQDLIKQSARR
ncbi:type IV secretion system protein TraC [Pseudoalteromonas luteoviolacea]|uniref:type IV secretion system protein TraC n=1 Tax=Pseudoalteromonas luteoviolacea TaxID=43657 RepID=UPI001B36796E|nr:type IV secretion system protein TraC [Pseudoalteromonas luteoviolacea]MBQ4840000.1 type IV secretion system protein TraC [Pseudoalteromonas luteoviolacea]